MRMTTAEAKAAARVTYQLETLWDYDYEPTHEELETLYETAKKNQWNGSTAIDWGRPIGKEGPVLNVQVAFAGTHFFSRLTPEEQREVEVRVSAWRLSQFLHGEQGALVVCGQLVNGIPELDAKLYAATQVVDEGRHVEVFERYVKRLLERKGWRVETTPLTRDRGIDLIARRADEVGVEMTLYVQCKNHVVPVGVEAVRELNGALPQPLSGAQGVLVCPSGFTAAALAFAKERGLTLWDRHHLFTLAGE